MHEVGNVNDVRTNVAESSTRRETQSLEGLSLVRSNHLGGMTAGKWHLTRERDDHSALCGREHWSIGGFTCSMAPAEGMTMGETIDWLAALGYVCKRCLNHV